MKKVILILLSSFIFLASFSQDKPRRHGVPKGFVGKWKDNKNEWKHTNLYDTLSATNERYDGNFKREEGYAVFEHTYNTETKNYSLKETYHLHLNLQAYTRKEEMQISNKSDTSSTRKKAK